MGETRRNLGPRMEDAALDCAATPGTGEIDPGRLQIFTVPAPGSLITGASGRDGCTWSDPRVQSSVCSRSMCESFVQNYHCCAAIRVRSGGIGHIAMHLLSVSAPHLDLLMRRLACICIGGTNGSNRSAGGTGHTVGRGTVGDVPVS